MDKKRQIAMADVGAKAETLRTARAQVTFVPTAKIMRAIRNKTLPKGDVLAAAQLAGIQAVKQTANLIPLCHPLRITHADVQLQVKAKQVVIVSEVHAFDRTGVEMEALTAASVAALTLYDMTKPLGQGAQMKDLMLLEKTGGRSGHWKRK